MLDDGSKVWLADMNGDGRAELTAQGVQDSTFSGIFTGLSNGVSFGWWSRPW